MRWISLGVAVLVSAALIFFNRTAVHAVEITQIQGTDLPSDPTWVKLVGGDETAELRIQLFDGEHWEGFDEMKRMPSRVQLTFHAAETDVFPMSVYDAIRIEEVDGIKGDVLDQFTLQPGKQTGQLFDIDVATRQSWWAGVQWYLIETWLGRLIALYIGLVFLIEIVSAIGSAA